MTTTPDTIDPATVPTELRQMWVKRGAGKLAASAGVFCQTREGVVQWSLRGHRVVVWRKRGRLHVNAGTGTSVALTSRAGMLLETWGQLEAIVSQLVPAIPRTSALSDPGPDMPAWVDLVTPNVWGGL